MIKRTLYFGNPSQIRLKDKQLQAEITQLEETKIITVPIEDIGIVLVDHPQISLSLGVIQALQENNVALITCDQRHMPQSLLLPLEGHSTQQERFEAQLESSQPLKKQLWAQTVECKIKNQQSHLEALGINADYLVPLHKNVKSGDSDNTEATAAVFYWQKLFTDVNGFVRFREGPPPNNLLNYGYAILRATVARSLVASGLIPTIGIFHGNRYNAFCLADDIMEPYRPFVDKVVRRMVTELGVPFELSREHKAILLQIPAMDVTIAQEKSPLMLATQRTAVSLVKCFMGEQRKIIYPEFDA